MPILAAGLLRAAIQMGVTLGLWEIASKLLDQAVIAIVKAFGGTEQQAKDIAANEWLKLGEALLGGTALLRTKTPTIIAEKLGFTSKGWALRSVSVASKEIQATQAAARLATVAEKAAVIEKAAPAIIAAKGGSLTKVSQVAQIIVAAFGVPVGVGLLITNTIDFGAWSSSAYQEQFQKLLAIFGLQPDRDYVKAQVLSGDMFDKIWATYINGGAERIHDPRDGSVVAFTRENVIKIADFVAAQIILEEGKVTTKQMIGALTALVEFGTPKSGSAAGGGTSLGGASSSSTGVKIFSGIVSQGTLGAGLAFTPRADDMIESVQELQDAAQNNLAPWLLSLPGKIIYEVKIVSSVTTKDGFKQSGQSRQVISGYYTDGKPRYKTITNKFATLTLYIMTDRGVKSKIGQIILGPTDSVKLNPSQSVIQALQGTIGDVVATTNIEDIKSIQTTSPVTIQATTPAPAPAASKPADKYDLSRAIVITTNAEITKYKALGWDIRSNPKNQSSALAVPPTTTPGSAPANTSAGSSGGSSQAAATPPATAAPIVTGTINPVTGSLEPGVSVAPKAGQTASNLSEWYAANGKSLPSVSARAQLYQQYGLGTAGLYVGTAEQNTKLLNYLKTH